MLQMNSLYIDDTPSMYIYTTFMFQRAPFLDSYLRFLSPVFKHTCSNPFFCHKVVRKKTFSFVNDYMARQQNLSAAFNYFQIAKNSFILFSYN